MDRVSAVRYTLKYLGSMGTVIAATHDIELTYLLEEFYDNYHFKEEIVEDNIVFDYKLRSGPATTRNAIEVLRVLKFPELIYKSVKEMANKIEEGALENISHTTWGN